MSQSQKTDWMISYVGISDIRNPFKFAAGPEKNRT